MSANILILKGTEIAAPTTSGTASNVGSARIVRCVNAATDSAHLVTLEESDGTDIGTLNVPANGSVIIRKNKTDKIFAGNAAVKLTEVGIYQG